MKKERVAPLFYFGMLISSVGSFAYGMSLIAFMLKSGFELWQASLIIGLTRFVPVVTTALWGHLTDVLPARKTVAVAEGIAGLTSAALLLIWSDANTNYPLLVVVCILRSIVVSFQTGSRGKITKLLSDDSYKANSRNAIWLNKATQGATLFGGLVAWIIIKHFTLQTAIVVDAVTFIINGGIAFMIPDFETKTSADATEKTSWIQKFRDFFNFNSRAAMLDAVLALSMMGTMAFMARMAGNDQSWTGLYLASFGLAVWISGYLERGITSNFSTLPYWITLSGSFVVLGLLKGPGPLTLFIFFLKDMSYWIIYHRISTHIQIDTPSNKMGSVISARMAIMVTILAVGEILVGAWSHVVPIAFECFGRGFIAIFVGGILLITGYRKAVLNDRPAL